MDDARGRWRALARARRRRAAALPYPVIGLAAAADNLRAWRRAVRYALRSPLRVPSLAGRDDAHRRRAFSVGGRLGSFYVYASRN